MNLELHLRNVGLAGDRLKGAGFYHRIAACHSDIPSTGEPSRDGILNH